MKINRIYYLLMLVFCVGLSSCEKEEELYPQLGDDPRNLTEVIESTLELSTFSEAMVQVDLDSILRNSTTYTVFAPNNTAFDGIDVSAYSEAEFENLLLNHVINTTTADFTPNLATGYVPTMASGPDGEFLDAFINTSGTVIVNGTASFVEGSFDIGTTNGVLHIVDGVLAPPTIVHHTQINPDFSMLAEAIELAGLAEALSVTNPENENFPFTVFAPNNTAFEAFMMQMNGAFGYETLADIPVETLQEILMYHVIAGENTLAALVPGSEFTAMDGNTFFVDGNSVISDASYSTGNVVLTDVQAINGVIHGIDKVLLPESVFQNVLGATLNLKARAEDRGYTSFLAAVEKVGIGSTLETEELTLFAPNNEAFVALFAVIENFASLDDFNTEEELATLEALLKYHLHEGVLMSSQLTDGGTISTLQGDEITADLSGEDARLRPTYADAIPSGIVDANIGATNGIIHEINRVLVPNELVSVLGFPTDEGGVCPVGNPELVFFDWDAKGPWWGSVVAENDPALSLDGSSYGRANFQTGGTGWVDLFWRNDASTLYGAQIVGDDLEGYSLKFDINTIEPITDGMFRIRFRDADGVDAFYNWQPWNDTGQPFSTDGWETIEIPLSVLGVPDFSLVDAEFGMAFEGADTMLNFAIDNVRFDTPGGCAGPDPVENADAVFFDWDANGPWWGQVVAENDPSITLDGSSYGRANFQTGGTGWVDLFWRNDASTFHGADMVGSNIDDYVLKFDIATFEPITDGVFRIRFRDADGVDAFYNWAPWEETGEPFSTDGQWVTVTIPLSLIGQPDYSLVDAEFGMAFEGADVLLNFAIDNVRFEEK
ncbi:glycan-binding surface protein [Salinimicrobium terrae]|uniref:glycan-binding surface protein n=1 Tax=Salinimicrobium terrae TaxID=470866 RepID=UPI00042989B2|nr:glycan-binding surface protein [Salinimicrobium terrae]